MRANRPRRGCPAARKRRHRADEQDLGVGKTRWNAMRISIRIARIRPVTRCRGAKTAEAGITKIFRRLYHNPDGYQRQESSTSSPTSNARTRTWGSSISLPWAARRASESEWSRCWRGRSGGGRECCDGRAPASASKVLSPIPDPRPPIPDPWSLRRRC
jgi:hypothetical protein